VDLFVALGILLLLLGLFVAPAVGELQADHPGWAAVLAVAGGVAPVANLLRYRRARWGCLALALGVTGYGGLWLAGRSTVACAWAVAVPNGLFLLGDLGLRPLVAHLQGRAAAARARSAATAAEAAAVLVHPAAEARAAAAEALGRFAAAEVVPAAAAAVRDAPAGRRGEAFAVLAARRADALAEVTRALEALLAAEDAAVAGDAAWELARADPAAAARLAPSADRPAVRLGFAQGLVAAEAEPEQAAGLLGGLLSDPETPGEVSSDALDTLAGLPGDLVRAELRTRLAEAATAELLWGLVEHGRPEEAPLAAEHVAAPDYATANAAVEAVAAILDRADDDLGPAAGPTRERLAAGRARVREVHAPGDNRLADGLVGALEELEAALGEPGG